jgi:8-oxo-dGTP diphosphatase
MPTGARPPDASPASDPTRSVVAVVLLGDEGAALMQLRDDKPGLRRAGMWVPPGGHREPGESAEDCARREFLEETGYVCGALEPLASLLDDPGDGRPADWLTVFAARYDGAQPVQCREGQALRFLERHRAESYPIPRVVIELWDRAIATLARSRDRQP